MRKKEGFIAFVIFVLVLLIYCILIQIKANKEDKAFYLSHIESIVVRSNDWKGRSIDYYLKNEIRITCINSKEPKLQIGDSISKGRNTYIYDVYRKEDGQYAIIKRYDYSDIFKELDLTH